MPCQTRLFPLGHCPSMKRNFLFLGSLLLPFALQAADSNATEKKSGTHKVKAAPFKIELKLKGIFTPTETAPIKVKPEVWANLTLENDAVAHGSSVKVNDLLISLKKEKMEQHLIDTELSLEEAKLGFAVAKAEYEFAISNASLDAKVAERSLVRLEEDMKRYMEKTRELSRKSAEQSRISAENSLSYAQEELKQLKKMYDADDITEETEEIILQRAQHSVDRSIHFLNRTRNSTQKTLEFTLPREEEDITLNLDRARLSTKKATATHDENLAKLKVGLQKQKRSLEHAGKNLAKLKRDAALLDVRSPLDGVLYHGAFMEGTWMGRKAVQGKLKKGGKLLSGEVVMTVVSLKDLALRASLTEADFRKVAPKMKGWATPTAEPGQRVAIEVKTVSTLPASPGQYTLTFAVTQGDKTYLHPGMSCSIHLPVLDKPKAITVPTRALSTNSKGQIVLRLKAEGKGSERLVRVKTGTSHGGKTEILKGVSEGDEVILP